LKQSPGPPAGDTRALNGSRQRSDLGESASEQCVGVGKVQVQTPAFWESDSRRYATGCSTW